MTVVQVDDGCTRTWIVGAMSCAYNSMVVFVAVVVVVVVVVLDKYKWMIVVQGHGSLVQCLVHIIICCCCFT